MKKGDKILIIVMAIFPLIGGFMLGKKYANTIIIPEETCTICENHTKIEENTTKLLDNMWTIFDRHDLLDTDGSDEMSELLEAQSNLAEIYNW